MPDHTPMFLCGIQDDAKIHFWDNVYGFKVSSLCLLRPCSNLFLLRTRVSHIQRTRLQGRIAHVDPDPPLLPTVPLTPPFQMPSIKEKVQRQLR